MNLIEILENKIKELKNDLSDDLLIAGKIQGLQYAVFQINEWKIELENFREKLVNIGACAFHEGKEERIKGLEDAIGKI